MTGQQHGADAHPTAKPTPDQVAGQVRFALATLGESNGAHQFESLCRQLARIRIASNLLPATGPVGSGGDQGRDFETYRSYLAGSLDGTRGFVGLVSEAVIVFACTLQQAGLRGKVGRDVESIMAQGTTPEAIYYFCSAPITVSLRHRLITDALTDHGVHLEVFDGPALAEELASPDAFWIAERYLAMPSELRPVSGSDGSSDWYSERLQKWKKRGEARPATGELLELRDCLRHCYQGGVTEDFDFWFGLVADTVTADTGLGVRQRARYELVIASFVGLDDFRSVERHFRDYIADLEGDSDSARLSDASILLTYAATAVGRSGSTLSPKDLTEHRQYVSGLLEGLASEAKGPNQLAGFLETLGSLAMQPDPSKFEAADRAEDPRPSLLEIRDEVNKQGIQFDPSMLVDVDRGMDTWCRLANLLDDAPLFPVERFSSVLRVMATSLVDHPRWRELIDKVDEALYRVRGASATAEAARDRAMSLRKAGRTLQALHELHRAKADWWSGDTIRGSTLAMLLLSDCYIDLQLPYAAKHYAMAAARIASGDDDLIDLMAPALLRASELDYAAGAWMGALDLVNAGLLAQNAYSPDAVDGLDESLLSRVMLTVGMCQRGAASLQGPESLRSAVEDLADKFGIGTALREANEQTAPWSTEQLLQLTDEQLLGRPFSDIGPERIIRFSGLGLDWTVRASNSYSGSLAAERFAAAAQILLVELADDELCLLRGPVNAWIVERSSDDEEPQLGLRGGQSEWRVPLTPSVEGVAMDPQGAFVELLASLVHVLSRSSLLEWERLNEVLQRAFERGLGHKLAAGRPYDDLCRVVSEADFAASPRSGEPLVDSLDAPFHHPPELPWPDGPGPGYSPEAGTELVAGRYARMGPPLAKLLGDLNGTREFLATKQVLREDGWLDWHILLGVFNVAVNHRLQADGPVGLEAFRSANQADTLQAALGDLERYGMEVAPREIFTLDALREARRLSLPATVQHWDLQMHEGPAELDAVEDFLEARFGYWSDDAAHELLV